MAMAGHGQVWPIEQSITSEVSNGDRWQRTQMARNRETQQGLRVNAQAAARPSGGAGRASIMERSRQAEENWLPLGSSRPHPFPGRTARPGSSVGGQQGWLATQAKS